MCWFTLVRANTPKLSEESSVRWGPSERVGNLYHAQAPPVDHTEGPAKGWELVSRPSLPQSTTLRAQQKDGELVSRPSHPPFNHAEGPVKRWGTCVTPKPPPFQPRWGPSEKMGNLCHVQATPLSTTLRAQWKGGVTPKPPPVEFAGSGKNIL